MVVKKQWAADKIHHLKILCPDLSKTGSESKSNSRQFADSDRGSEITGCPEMDDRIF